MSMLRHCCCDYHYFDSEDLEAAAAAAVEADIFYQAEAVEVVEEKMT
jgi:hypothetical protein